MELLKTIWDLVVHLDQHLAELLRDYGTWTYGILFLIIFCETGLIVTPFLPGDSLLFIAGALAAKGGMNVHLLVILLIIAAILGDALNYYVGRYFGKHPFITSKINPAHLQKAHDFYERHGGKTIIIARFIPIVRTYAPFVAGAAQMGYRQFGFYNIVGALIWVLCLTYAGYFFGNIPIVQENLTAIIFGIIGVSLLPLVWAWVSSKFSGKSNASTEQ